MIARAIFTENYDEIKEAHRLELKAPTPIHVPDTFGFYMNDVKRFHKTNTGNIRMYFEDGSDWTIEYTEELWNRLIEMFEE